jgi:uncharacterized protein DUF4241
VTEGTATGEIVYCEGWDPATESVVGPLPAEVARRRDAAGEQYAVLITGPEPLALFEVCWAAHHVAVWRFDDRRRRDAVVRFRRLPALDGERADRLVPFNLTQWRYADDTAEFDDSVPRWAADFTVEDRHYYTRNHWPEDVRGLEINRRVRPVPAFGEWTRLGRLDEVLGQPTHLTVAADPPATDPVTPPWQPPEPMRPRWLDEMFQPGARFTGDDGPIEVELRTGPELWLPSGKLVAADPDPWMHEMPHYVDVVEPGKYPVTVAVARFGGERPDTRVAAGKVVISETPVVSWEPALRADEDPLMLGDGEFFGIGIDAGCVALVDAEIAESYEDTIEDYYDDLDDLVNEIPEPESGANLITVASGWGDGAYPMWVGRAEDGSVSCFVVDFLVLRAAEPVR